MEKALICLIKNHSDYTDIKIDRAFLDFLPEKGFFPVFFKVIELTDDEENSLVKCFPSQTHTQTITKVLLIFLITKRELLKLIRLTTRFLLIKILIKKNEI